MRLMNIILFVPVMFFFSSCTTIKNEVYHPTDNSEDMSIKGTEKTVVILYHGTKFRDDIVKQLKEKLISDKIKVILDDASRGKNYDPKRYDLVVVFSGIHAFIPDAYPNDYLYRNRKEKNIIKVFYTYLTKKGITIKTGNEDKIDTITAASMKENKAELVDDIYNLIKTKLEDT